MIYTDQMLERLSGFSRPMRLNTSLTRNKAADLSCYDPPCRSHGGSIYFTNYLRDLALRRADTELCPDRELMQLDSLAEDIFRERAGEERDAGKDLPADAGGVLIIVY